MSSRIVLLTLRAVAIIVGVGFVLESGKSYFLSECGTKSLPVTIYVIFGLLVLWYTYQLSMRSVVVELRARANSRHVPQSLREGARVESYVESVHRYPLHLIALVVAFALVWMALPFLSATYSRVVPATYIFTFGLGTVLLVIAVRLILYSVTIKQESIVVSAFTSQEIAFEQIAQVAVVTTRNGPQIVVSLKNGKVLRFGCQLTGFREIRDILMTKSSSTSSRG